MGLGLASEKGASLVGCRVLYLRRGLSWSTGREGIGGC